MSMGLLSVSSKLILHVSIRRIRQSIDSQKNYYEILGIKRSATQKEIKDAFYKLSKKASIDMLVVVRYFHFDTVFDLNFYTVFDLCLSYHPDITGSSPESVLTQRFIEIKDAYDVLKNDESRLKYDTDRTQMESDYTTRTYQSRANNAWRSTYATWRSNRYAGSSHHADWSFNDAHLKKVFEEMRRSAAEYEKAQRVLNEQYWKKFYQSEKERYGHRREMPPRPNVKIVFDSWLGGPLRPYLPYLSAALVVYMIAFFTISLYSIVRNRIPDETDANSDSQVNFSKINETPVWAGSVGDL
ncbi:unnamed protein product [Thelazia callipaeda]|uniref:J domain-containing protein n=1 Tax=Thelazia callipaeda TaxID=103827 RepID=A0A0N5D947_THECL|nr:unnamed protein product [Thelazia callipaeda]